MSPGLTLSSTLRPKSSPFFAEFIFLLLKTDFSNGSSIAEFFKTTLKGDIYGYKEIIALQLAETKTENGKELFDFNSK